MIKMRERDIENAVILISAFIRNKDNWMIDRDKAYIIKLKGTKQLLAGKIVYISYLGNDTLLSLAVLKRKFSFRHFRFIPYIKIMNVPLANVEYIQNAIPEIVEDTEKEEEIEKGDISYI